MCWGNQAESGAAEASGLPRRIRGAGAFTVVTVVGPRGFVATRTVRGDASASREANMALFAQAGDVTILVKIRPYPVVTELAEDGGRPAPTATPSGRPAAVSLRSAAVGPTPARSPDGDPNGLKADYFE